LGSLSLGLIQVVAEEQGSSLPLWERQQRAPHLISLGQIGGLIEVSRLHPSERGSFDQHPSSSAATEVDDHPEEIGAGVIGISEGDDPSRQTNESLLGDVLGYVAIAC
jgi:hypothetical protein